jgi:translation initiation factor 2B subunit (eIF-2B alpha/beta/delta family)
MERVLTSGLVATALNDVRSDVHSGATLLTRKAARCLDVFSEFRYLNATRYWTDLQTVGRALIEAQPSMASIFHLVNSTLLAVEPLRASGSVAVLQKGTRDALLRFMHAMETSLEAIAQQGQGLLTTECTVLTHSSSNTVAGIFRQAARMGKRIQAIATESRPFCEGREMARNLGQQGVPTRVILDAAVARYISDADVVIVGAGRISDDSFINKVGTLGLAMAARNAKVPFYVACESTKLLPASVRTVREVLDLSEQKTAEEWMNVEVVHSFFEEIPNQWITGIITEEGILSINALSKRFKNLRVSEGLLRSNLQAVS